jgi:hypothetical protein
MKIKYWFDDFDDLEELDLVSLEDLSKRFQSVNKKIAPSAEHTAGWNDEYLSPDKHDIKEGEFWNGYNPQMHFISNWGKGFQVKSDISSMIMDDYGKEWDYFIYLSVPNKVMKEYFISTHDNKNVKYIKEFVDEINNTTGWSSDKWRILLEEYDKKHPIIKNYDTMLGEMKELEWRADFIPEQYISIKENGLVFPIIYNNTRTILSRGTHRALACELADYDVPFFIQVKKDDIVDNILYIESEPVFTFGRLHIEVDYTKKEIKYKNEQGELLHEIRH